MKKVKTPLIYEMVLYFQEIPWWETVGLIVEQTQLEDEEDCKRLPRLLRVTCKKSSDFHDGIRFQSRFTIKWELEDKNFLKIHIICLDDSVKYHIMAIKRNENFITFSTA